MTELSREEFLGQKKKTAAYLGRKWGRIGRILTGDRPTGIELIDDLATVGSAIPTNEGLEAIETGTSIFGAEAGYSIEFSRLIRDSDKELLERFGNGITDEEKKSLISAMGEAHMLAVSTPIDRVGGLPTPPAPPPRPEPPFLDRTTIWTLHSRPV